MCACACVRARVQVRAVLTRKFGCAFCQKGKTRSVFRHKSKAKKGQKGGIRQKELGAKNDTPSSFSKTGKPQKDETHKDRKYQSGGMAANISLEAWPRISVWIPTEHLLAHSH